MTKLRDLVNVNINRDMIQIQGVEIPVIFTFKSFPYLTEAYGKPYHIFEKDLNRMLQAKNVNIGRQEVRLMNSLIYSMVRSGGTECTPHELENSIPIHDLPGVFETILPIFNRQIFQSKDAKKVKSGKKK